jgi:hypothetical protein
MAEQGTEEKTDSTGDEGAGRHAASEDSGSGEQQAPAEQSTGSSEQEAESSGQGTESSGEKTESSNQKSDSAEQTSEQKTQEHSNGQARSGRSQDNGSAPNRGEADTSWAEPEEPSGSPRHRSVDVGELAWRTGNVLATVVRTLALLFAVVLVVNVVLVLVGVNPANGVAQFVAAVADVVILGFRDLFLPADPSMTLIVNSAIAAVFWVFVGELLSRVIRFLAARVK